MSEDYRPRENDHLVEPMYEALREGAPSSGGRGRRWGWVLLALFGAVVAVGVMLVAASG